MPGPVVDPALLLALARMHLEDRQGPTEISLATGIARSTASKYVGRLAVAHVTAARLAQLTAQELFALLTPRAPAASEKPEPDWTRVHLELRRPHVTKQLLWQEYREACPDGYEYSRFCERYSSWARQVPPTMRQLHVPGARMFVDFSGGTLWYTDVPTGEEREAKLFLAVLGGSSLTYVEPAQDETLATWIGCHVRALEFFGGVPAAWVPDNLRAAVTKSDRYEPLINSTYAQVASHYGAGVLPARARRPRDKAKAEAGVKVANRWVLARLRNEEFLSFAALRAAVRPLVDKINDKPMRALGLSRRQLFESTERACLRPLPRDRYEWCEWGRATIGSDYHALFDRHFYSVPHVLGGHTLDVRATAATVEILDGTKRVASHVRSRKIGDKTTLNDHMPASHRAHAEWTPERVRAFAATLGPDAPLFVDALLADKPHPEHGYRACLGLVALARRYPHDRIDKACARALRARALSLRSLRSILANDLDRVQPEPDKGPLPAHENLRGPDYFE